MSIIGTLSGTLGGIATGGPVGGLLSGVAGGAAGMVLQGLSTWILDGTRGALEAVANLVGSATAPNLGTTWFSSTYWRVAALAAMLTLPFLGAAAVQAVARADLGLLTKAALGYLPASLVGVSLAAPFTMLALAATDQMSGAVSASAATDGARFLDHAAAAASAMATTTGGSPFFAVIVGLLALMAAMALAIELLIRAAAVYVVVLMLPLAFAALVWPARRVWAARMVELLASLILSKFVIVAVLSLAGAAFGQGLPGTGELLVAMSLLLLSTASPWVLLRILPFTELAAGAAGALRGELPVDQARSFARNASFGAAEVAMELPARLLSQAASTHTQGAPMADTASATDAGATRGEPSSTDGTDGRGWDAAASGATSWMTPPVGTTAEGGGSGASSASDPGPGAPTAPFILPPAWRSEAPIRLDESLLGAASPPDPSTSPPGPSSAAPKASPTTTSPAPGAAPGAEATPGVAEPATPVEPATPADPGPDAGPDARHPDDPSEDQR